ncbi:MAG: DUF3500 domain-containing protein [Planctomycetes bacterium]|nr:DUF3500 domain-containing protein [Planctomycetota bacterium]
MACRCDGSGFRSGKALALTLTIAGLLALAVGSSATSYLAEETSGSKMTKAAKDFLSSLEADRKKEAVFDFGDKERTNWNFVPLQDKQRNPTRKGIRLELLSQAQKEKALALLRTGTSDRGYQSALDIMNLESVLNRQEKPGGNVRNPGWYFISVFGEPGSESGWGWRWEGHHLALNFSLRGLEVTGTTPAFFGANPAEVRSGPEKGKLSIEGCASIALKLIGSFSPDQVAKAEAAKAGIEIDQGQSKPPATALTGDGLATDSFNENQSGLLGQLLREYTGRLPAELEARELALIKGQPAASVKFQFFRDKNAKGNPTTYRIEAPGYLIQYLNVQPDGEGNPANHIHSSYRRVKGDFGSSAN